MTAKCLFGPVDSALATRYLGPLRAVGECVTFGPRDGDGIDVVVPFAAPWAAVEAALPTGIAPAFVALNAAYAPLPAWVAETPLPVVGLAADANLLWDAYRLVLPLCDRVLTDAPSAERLRRAGMAHVHVTNLYGGSDAWLPATPPEAGRDIDVLFVGNLHPAVQAGRLPVVASLAQLAERHRVVIRTGVPFDEYRQLLQRSRVVLNPTARREWNQRVCEAAFCGAALAIEADNAEVFDVLRPGEDCVAFMPEDLVASIEALLANEDRRVAMARSAQGKLADATYARLFRDATARLGPDLEELRQRRSERPPVDPAVVLRARLAAQAVAVETDPALYDLAGAGASDEPMSVNGAALLQLREADRPGAVPAAFRTWGDGLAKWPGHPVLGYNLARALLLVERHAEALDLVRRMLRDLAATPRFDTAAWSGTPWPSGFDEVHAAWQRAGWDHPGDPTAQAAARRDVLGWWLHMLVGDLDQSAGVAPYYESVLARPDLARGRAGLGCALARDGRVDLAAGHLAVAVATNPFDRRAATAYFQILGDAGRADDQAAFVAQRRLLHAAAPGLVPMEPWLAPPPPPRPAGDELASIVVPVHGQADCTRVCLEAVLRFTRAPYEVIVVDNASPDGTPALLEEFRQRPGPARFEVVRNAENLGFGRACNQGIAASRGRYVVLLNNDAVVTPGWLDKLVALSLHDWPTVGMTGPVSNAATPEQTVEATYADAQQMLAFAAAHAARFAGQARARDRLSGFCLLVRREVLDAVGAFDERFGLGFFEDDDLSLRARKAGYRLMVAHDVFVHHDGSRTIRALGLDAEGRLRDNLARFVDKWGGDTPDGYRNAAFAPLGTTERRAAERAADAVFRHLDGGAEADHDALFGAFTVDVAATPSRAATPASTPLPATPRGPARVSLCVIAKDEEHNLRDCVAPVRHLFHEVVVNDTGSRDGTVELARSLGAKVVENPWQDHFALARNQVLEAATGDWIFWLDADDRVDPDEASKLGRLFGMLAPGVRGYALTCRCVAPAGETDVTHVRLFPRHPKVRWQHRVHEQILPAIRALGGDVVFTDAVVRHVGYADPALRGRKLDRDLRLLEMERKELGDHPFTLFNLGCIHLEREDHPAALPLFETSLANSHVRDSIVRKLFANVARCRWHLGRRADAMAACRDGLGHYPHDDELLFLLAQYHQESREFAPAIRLYHDLVDGPREAAHFGSTATGLRGYRAMSNLALAYRDSGDLAQAECWFRHAVADFPGYVTGWVALGEVLAAQGRWGDAAVAFARAAELVPGDAGIQARLADARHRAG